MRTALAFAFTLAAALMLAAMPSRVHAQAGVSFESAVATARVLAARRDVDNARAIIRATNAYAAGGGTSRSLPEAHAAAFEALLATHGAASADWLARDDAQRARVRDARVVLGAVRNPGKAKPEAVARAVGDGTCHLLLDATVIRPAEARRVVESVLEGGFDFADDQKRCLVRAVASNPEFAHGPLPPLGALAASGDEETLALLVQFAAAQGSFPKALAFAAEATDAGQRARLQAAVVTMRQFASIALPEPDLLRALWTNARQRTGGERLLFGSLLASRATAEFWIAEAGNVAEFAGRDPAARAVVALAARRALAGSTPASRAALWSAAPSMRPSADFLVVHAAFSDPAVEVAIPPGTDPAIARAIRVARGAGASFGRTLAEFPGTGAGALEVAALVVSAIGAARAD
ncbi:MAG: hypothetical protein ACO3EK_14205 [Alphaproteobacteria bacterium]|jgi:hypothetical protein